MDTTAATEYVENQAMTLSPEEFELLYESVLSGSLPSARLSMTTFRRGDGVNIDGHTRNLLLDVSPDVQAKQYGSSDTVGPPKVQRFQGTPVDTGCDTGTAIIVSSLTTPAVESAERAGIHLVNGSELFDSMINLRVGAHRQGVRFGPDGEFWNPFGEPGGTGVILSKRVPFANSFEALDAVLSAIDDTHGEKGDVVESAGASPRRTDLYVIAGWVLGFVRQKRPDEESHRQRRQSLTRSGTWYVAYRAAGLGDEAEILLLDGIRNAEIIGRFVNLLSESGSLGHSDLVNFVASELELSRSSTKRRDNSTGIWLARLPEVSVENGREKRYVWNRG